MPHITRSDFCYTALFCEENSWKLIESLYINPLAKPIDIIFILNRNETIALFNQKKSNFNQPVIWDYHVILTAQLEENIIVFDFDSRCDFPTPLNEYFAASFPDDIVFRPTHQAFLKPIPANEYFKHFHSDRQHMIGVINKTEFPNYDIITPENNIKKLTLKQCRNTEINHSMHKLISPKEYLKKILINDLL